MKISTLLLLSCISISAQEHSAISNLGLFKGYWEMVKGERRTEEFWLPQDGNILLGISRTVKNGKLIEYEFMRIEQDSTGSVYYIAKPSSQPEASFKMIKHESNLVIFENSLHDFPQRIIYHWISADSMIARIEGLVRGKSRSVEFPYTKIKN